MQINNQYSYYYLQTPTALPNSIDPGDRGGGRDNKSREISASGSKAEFASTSGVLVAMQNTTYTQSGTVMNSVSNPGSTAHVGQTDGASLKQRPSDSPSQEREKKSGEQDVGEPSTTAADFASTSFQPSSKAVSSRLEQHTPVSTPQRNGLVSPSRPSTLLFFIHGVGGSSDVWHAQLKHFAKQGYEIVAPDLIGHGLSCTPRDAKSYHFLEIAADMEEMFDKYCKKRNIVIGHSYG